MSLKSTRSFCQKLVMQKNSGGSYIIVDWGVKNQIKQSNHFSDKERDGCFKLIMLLLLCDC